MHKTYRNGTVAEAMTDSVFTVSPERTWKEAARLMGTKGIHHLVIVNERHEPIGVLSSLDFVFQVLGGLEPDKLGAGPIGNRGGRSRLITVTAESKLVDAANLMSVHHIDCLPVLADDGKLAGIVTARDLMEASLDSPAEASKS